MTPRYVAAALLVLLATPAVARRVICIDGNGDGPMNTAEGYFRAHAQQDDNLQVGGGLAGCLGATGNADRVTFVAHGGPGTFTWGGTTYAGFGPAAGGGGTKVPRLPVFATPNALSNAAGIELWSCYSARPPWGQKNPRDARSVVESLNDVFGRVGPAVSGVVQKGKANFDIRYQGGGPVEQNAARDCTKMAAKAAGFKYVSDWAARFPPASAANSVNETINATNCAGTAGMVTVVLEYGPPRDPPGSPYVDDDSLEVFMCDHGCATTGPIGEPAKRAKLAAKCNDLVLKKGPAAAVLGPCRGIVDNEPDEGCATPQVSDLTDLVYGPNDFSTTPSDGVAASAGSARQLKCQKALGREVAKGLARWLKACAKGLPPELGDAFGTAVTKACEGVLAVADPLTDTVLPGIEAPCGPLVPGSPIDAASLVACLGARVATAGTAACPISSPSGAFLDLD